MTQLPELKGSTSEIGKASIRRRKYLHLWARHYSRVNCHRNASADYLKLIEKIIKHLCRQNEASYWNMIPISNILIPRQNLAAVDLKLWQLSKECRNEWTRLLGYRFDLGTSTSTEITARNIGIQLSDRS